LIRFLIETIVGLLAAGALLGAAIPLLHGVLEPLPRLVFQALVWTVAAGCVLVVMLRRGGSLRN
jgi:hypothetical protein